MTKKPARTPEEAWKALEKMAVRDEGERVAALSDAELLELAGIDTKAARARGAALAAELLAKRAKGGGPRE